MATYEQRRAHRAAALKSAEAECVSLVGTTWEEQPDDKWLVETPTTLVILRLDDVYRTNENDYGEFEGHALRLTVDENSVITAAELGDDDVTSDMLYDLAKARYRRL